MASKFGGVPAEEQPKSRFGGQPVTPEVKPQQTKSRFGGQPVANKSQQPFNVIKPDPAGQNPLAARDAAPDYSRVQVNEQGPYAGLDFENIKTNERFLNTAKKFYKERDGADLNDKEVVDYFIDDRVEKDARITSFDKFNPLTETDGSEGGALDEMLSMEDMSEEQKQRFAELSLAWREMPTAVEGMLSDKEGRGLYGVAHNVGEAALDPTTYVTGGLGSLAAKGIGLQGAKQVAGRIGVQGALEGGVGFGHDVAQQETEKEVGLRDEIDYGQAALSGGIQAGASIVPDSFVRSVFKRDTNKRATIDFETVSNYNSKDPSQNYIRMYKNGELDRQAYADESNRVNASKKPERSALDRGGDALVKRDQPLSQRVKDLATELSSTKHYLNEKASEVFAGVSDSKFGVERLERRSGIDPLSGENTVWQEMQLAENSATLFQVALTKGLPKYTDKGIDLDMNMSLSKVFEPLEGDVDRFLRYMLAERVRSKSVREGKKIEDYVPGWDTKLVDQMVEEGRANNTFNATKGKYQEFTKGILTFAKDSGYISEDAFGRMMEAEGDFFVPAYRVATNPKTGKARPDHNTGSSGMRRMTGKEDGDPVGDLAENLMRNISTTIEGSLRNRARQRVFDLIKAQDPEQAKIYAERVYKPRPKTQDGKVNAKRVRKGLEGRLSDEEIEGSEFLQQEGLLNMEQVKKYLEQHDLDESVLEDSLTAGQVEFWRMTKQKGDDGIQMVLRNGEPEYWKINDKPLQMALENFGYSYAANMGMFGKLAGRYPKELLSATVTTFPDYLLRNGARDTVSAAVLSKEWNWRTAPFANTMYGTLGRIVNKKEYADFMANGGGFANIRQTESGELGANLKFWYMKHNIDPTNVLTSPRAIYDLAAKGLRASNEVISTVENAPRFAEFMAAKKTGKGKRRAASGGRLVSTDFSAQGAYRPVQLFNAISPFLNAGIQSISYMGRQVGNRPATTITKAFGLVTVPTLLLRAGNEGYDIVDEAPDHVKDTHFIVPVDKDGNVYPGNDKAVGLKYFPKSYDVGAVAGSMVDRFMDAFENNEGTFDAADESIYHMFRIMQKQMLLDPTPQAIRSTIDVWKNEKFSGAPVVPPQMQGIEPTEQFDEQTNLIIKEVAQATGQSPKIVEHHIRSFTGSWGALIMDTSDRAIRAMDEGTPDLPSIQTDDIPLIGVYKSSSPLKVTQSEIEFYRLFENTAMGAKTFDYLAGNQRVDRLEHMMENNPIIKRSKALNPELSKVIKEISGANEKIRSIRRKPDSEITPEQRRKQIDEVRRKVQGGISSLVDKLKEDPWARRAMRE